MASTNILRSRRSAAQLHAVASVEREIRANDHSAGRRYLRDFRDAYQSYQRVLTTEQVRTEISQADVALVADYHALPNCQRYLASLIRDPQVHSRPIVLGLETIFARDQHILNEWFQREIDDDELRHRIRFDLDWGYDWTPFYELLSAARDHAQAIYGLDCMPREDLRKIGARDRHASDKIAEIRGRHPDALILVFFGESHLAPNHLPQGVRKALPSESIVTVLQNVDALYWHAAGEATDRVEAVELANNVFCIFNATPLEKYENYRLYLNRWVHDGPGGPDLAPTMYNLIDGLVRLLAINRYSPTNTSQPRLLVDHMPEVYSRGSDTLLRRLLSRKGFSAEQRRAILRRVKERGSVYLPPLNVVYVRQFQMIAAAEDSARFLHHACRGLPDRANGHGLQTSLEDAFYATVMEHALACFGSRVLYPARPAFRDSELYELYELTREDLEQQTSLCYSEAIEAIDCLTLHRESHRGRRKTTQDVEWLTRAYAFTGRKYEFVTERLGLLVGHDIYDAYLDGRLNPPALRKLFLAHIEEPGVARETYFQLNAKVR